MEALGCARLFEDSILIHNCFQGLVAIHTIGQLWTQTINMVRFRMLADTKLSKPHTDHDLNGCWRGFAIMIPTVRYSWCYAGSEEFRDEWPAVMNLRL